MIREIAVLLRIQHLQERAGRVAVVGDGKLVHLIQHHDGIRNAAFVDAVDDPPRHRADIGAPMTADIRLIPDAAEADAHIFPAQRPRDALADAGLSRARSSDKNKDRAGLPLPQLHDRKLLQNTLFHLLQREMVRVEDLLRLRKIYALRLRFLPRQRSEEFQIIREQTDLRAVRAFGLQTADDLVRLLPREVVHPGLPDLHLQPADAADLLRVHLIQLLLEILDLLAERLLPLHVAQIFLFLALHLHAGAGQLDIFVDHRLQRVKSRPLAVLGQKRVKPFVRDIHPGRKRRADILEAPPRPGKGLQKRPPLKFFAHRKELFLHAGDTLLRRLLVHILNVRAARGRDHQPPLRLDRDVIDMDALHEPDMQKPLRTYFLNISRNAQRIHILVVQLSQLRLLPRNDHDDPLVLHRLLSGHILIKLRPIDKCRIRQDQQPKNR